MVRIFLIVGMVAALVLSLTALYLTNQGKQSGDSASISKTKETTTEKDDRLVMVWTSADPEVALDMVLMYTYNARKQGWWKDVTLVIWGPSQRLVVENEKIYLSKPSHKASLIASCGTLN